MSRPRRIQLLVKLGLIFSLLAAAAWGQEGVSTTDNEPIAEAANGASIASSVDNPPEPPPSLPPKIGAASGQIQYVGPDTYILLDAEGRPQPVPGMMYEDFLAAWKKSQQPSEPNRRPRYSIENIEIDGRTQHGHATLRFAATVHLLQDGPVVVPLGLVGAIVQGRPQFGAADDAPIDEKDRINNNRANSPDKRSEEYLTYDAQHGGFVAQLSGRMGQRRTVSLNLIVPLHREAAETTLQLGFPRALASKLMLDVNSAVADVSVNSGTLLAQEPTKQGGTRLEAVGAAGPFRLSWQTGDNGDGDFTTVLSAVGAIRVSMDGRSVRSDARLTVQSFGGSFERFRVRLPPGAQLVQDRPAASDEKNPAYRLSIDEEATGGGQRGPTDAGQVVLIEMSEKQKGPVIIELSTEQPIGIESGSSSVELAGFEVLGAVRQFGDLALEVADDWQARWDSGPNVRQVDPRELEATLQHPGLTAAFQYDRQPWSLGLRIAARQSRIHVTPIYELECLPEEARLTVRLTYQVFGARAFEFRIRTEGWEMTGAPLESGGLVDQDRISPGADGTLVLPLAQASSQRAEITFSVRRALPRDGTRLQLPLPVPLADSISTGELIVRPAAAFELQPDLQKSRGLTAISTTETTNVGGHGNGAELRYRTLLPDAVFVADRTRRLREVSAKAAARVEIMQDAARIEQRVEYDVRYEPIEELAFDAPSELLLDEEHIEIALISFSGDDEGDRDEHEAPLSWAQPQDEAEGPITGGTRRMRIVLPQPRLGRFVVRIRYEVRRPEVVTAEGGWRIPLIQPTDGEVTAAQAIVHAPPNLAIALDARVEDRSWTSAASPSETTAIDSSNKYVADRLETSLPLVVTAVNSNLPSEAAVDRIWLQTWFSGEVRQDRAAFHFRTAGTQAAVELPPRARAEEMEVLLDRQPADVVSRSGGRIVVRIATEDREQGASHRMTAHTLELRWRHPNRQGLVTRYRLTPPQLVGTAALSQVYWQIVLPGDEHIIRSPVRMTSASRWQWLNSFWGLRPVMSQSELEEWAGASAQLAPAAAHNEYLFTGLAPAMSIELVASPRWMIVLAASSSVLILVLIWIYVPTAHRAWLPVSVAFLVAALAVAFPTPALLLAQASVLGLVAAALSVLIARLMSRPARWPVSLSGGSSQRHVAPRPDSILMPPVATAASTAPTAPLRVQDSER